MKNQYSEDKLYLRTHVTRDLLQSASLFQNEKQVIWEYVSNGLEYIDEGTNPIVKVNLDSKNKKIIIADNGRGMDWAGLKNFFVMHGENIDRKKGRHGRGKFGTGKSAALGIADILRVTTVQKGKLSKVELSRIEIEKLNIEDSIEPKVLEKETKTAQPNGTMIEIEKVHLRSFDQPAVIKFIEHHLKTWRNATVFVNNHECEYSEPPISETKIFHPEGLLKDKLGEVKLIIKISSIPLEESERGVSICSHGIWHENTLAGLEGREMSEYIFGEIDVPQLDEDKSPIAPFDISRSMKLNKSNELVQNIYAFIGQKVDLVRRELVKEERKRKETEEAKRLSTQADAIAELINEDFSDFRQRIAKAKAKGGTGFDVGIDLKTGENSDNLIYGNNVPAEITSPTGSPGAYNGERSTAGHIPRMLSPQVKQNETESMKQGQYSSNSNKNKSPRGGFQVEFKPMGTDEKRAVYERDNRTIFINTDHPQLVSAKGSSTIDDPLFKRLSYEIAFSEYAIALAYELNENQNYIDISDPIFDIRDTINRIARRAANLFKQL